MHPELKNWARVHVFRVSTALVTIVLLVLGFFFHPDLLTWWLRTTMGLIETSLGPASLSVGRSARDCIEIDWWTHLVPNHTCNHLGSCGGLARCGLLASPSFQTQIENPPLIEGERRVNKSPILANDWPMNGVNQTRTFIHERHGNTRKWWARELCHDLGISITYSVKLL